MMQKAPKHLLAASALLAGFVGFNSVAQAATVTYTGANGGAWSDGANWSDGAVPDASDDAVINAGSSVLFDYVNGWPASNAKSVQVDGTITSSGGVIRSYQTVWNIGSTAVFGGYLVPWGSNDSNNPAAFNFDSNVNAAANISISTIEFGNDADVQLGFNFIGGGFNTITASGNLRIDNYAGQTIAVDMENYAGGSDTIVLMDFIGGTNVTSALFDTLNLAVTTSAGYDASYLQWNESTSAIELVAVVPEPSSFALIGGCLALGSVMLRRRRA